MNNTSSVVLNFKNVVYSMRSCPKTQALSLKVFYHYISVHCPKTQALPLKVFLSLYFRTLSQNPSFISIRFLLSIIFPYIVPKSKLHICIKFLNIIFPNIVPKPKFYLYNFLTLYFCMLSQNPSKAGRPS